MIKSWSSFNENVDDIKTQLSKKLMEVRDVFVDFEDMGIITYSIISSGFERGGYIPFDPKGGDFERFLDIIIPTLKLGNSNVKYKVSEKDFCIITHIKLPGEPNEFGSTVIGKEGINMFEDIIVANSRLIDLGYDVKLDLNSSHMDYKPVKFLIYFNL